MTHRSVRNFLGCVAITQVLLVPGTSAIVVTRGDASYYGFFNSSGALPGFAPG